MSVYKKNGAWWIDVYAEGRRVRRKISPNKRDAELAAKNVVVEAARGRWLGIEPAKRITFHEFFKEKYLPRLRRSPGTVRAYKAKGKMYYVPVFGDLDLQRIGPEHIEDYIARRLTDAKPSTVKLELSQLKAIFNAAIRWKYITENPAKGIQIDRVPETEIQPLTVNQVKRIYEVAKAEGDWMYPFLVVALNTGMRVGEIINLTWDDIDFRQDRIGVINDEDFKTKSRKNRYIPMNDFLVDVLRRQPRDIAGYLFPPVYKNNSGKTMHSDVPRRRFKSILKTAGLSTDIRVHDLRHTFGTRLGDNGENLRTIQKLMGHSTVEMTMRYIHTTEKKERAAVDGLGFDDRPIAPIPDGDNQRRLAAG